MQLTMVIDRGMKLMVLLHLKIHQCMVMGHTLPLGIINNNNKAWLFLVNYRNSFFVCLFFLMFCRILHTCSLKHDLQWNWLCCILFMTLKLYISWLMMDFRFHIWCIIIIFLVCYGEWFYFYTLDNILNFRLLWNLC